ncbi:MAG: spore coat associated protein CotJA [Thermoanaerobacteraceae bacterium]|nr:spore coat associated protein CotJA [Thermoanaerobacteraceae bacterium]
MDRKRDRRYELPCSHTNYEGRAYPYPWLDLAEAYVIWQELGELYPLEEALMKGTIFPELWRPYPYPQR